MDTREDALEDLEGMNWFETLSQEIEEKFLLFHSLLETRRVYLLERVKSMRKLYKEHQKSSNTIERLDSIIRTTKEVLTASLTAGDKDVLIKTCDNRIEELRRNKLNLDPISKLKFVVNSEDFSNCVKRMHLREIEVVEYKKRREPLVMKGKRGYGEEEVVTPKGISFDDTNDEVFIAEYYRNLICVYSLGGIYIRKFGNEQLRSPTGICLSGKFFFVSSADSVVSKFTKTGEFVKITTLEGENAIQLNIQENFCGSELKYPEDITIFNNQIFVLSQIYNSIDVFDTNHKHLRSIHFTGLQSQMSRTYFFTIDNKSSFVVSDHKAGCLKIFNPSGEYVEHWEKDIYLYLKVLP